MATYIYVLIFSPQMYINVHKFILNFTKNEKTEI